MGIIWFQDYCTARFGNDFFEREFLSGDRFKQGQGHFIGFLAL